MTNQKPLTWGELADLYDKAHAGRRARTLPMDTVFEWAEKQTREFYVSEDGSLFKNTQIAKPGE